MYKISIYNSGVETVIHYPNPDNTVPHVLQAPYVLKLSEASNVTLRIPVNNPGFNNIFPYKTLVEVTDIRDNEIVFSGRAVYPQKKMETNGEHYIDWICESELSYLNDTNVRDWNIQNLSVNDFLTQLLSTHNALSSSDKQFMLGNVEITGTITYQCNFETPLALITAQCVNNLGGQVQVRTQNGVRYLDYLNTIGQTNTTPVELSKNMLDMMLEQNNTDKFGTRIIPIGKDNLKITSVNNGLDYIQDANAISEFGIIELVVQYKDIADASALLAAATKDLPTYTQVLNKFECTAADLNKLDPTIESFGLGDDIKFTNPIFNMTQESYTVIEIDGDFLKPQSPKLTFANRLGRMTVRMQEIQAVSSIMQGLLSSNNQIASYFLDGAINALKNQILASGAYQHAQFIEGQGMLLENTDTTSEDYGALYLGPGIFAIANEKKNGQWNFRTFGTGNGFVADMITTGILNAGLIKTGAITSADGTFKLNLDNGHFTTYAEDTGYKALDFYNRSVGFYDFINSGQLIALLETLRDVDSNGNANGTPSVQLEALPGGYVGFGKIASDGSHNSVFKVKNNVNNSNKTEIEAGCDTFSIEGETHLDGYIYTGSYKGITKVISVSDGSSIHTIEIINGLIVDYN